MTGEMNKADVTRDAFPLHFAIARALRGTVLPFDVYQGPYVRTAHGRLWLCSNGGATTVYNEDRGTLSLPFWPYGLGATRRACKAAREVASGRQERQT